MNKDQFLKQYNLTEDQFSGKEKVGGSLWLDGLTAIPENFNPTVGGSLWLRGLTTIPENFNPTVGGSLWLDGLTTIPENFNPTVGGSLWLEGLTTIPENFNPTVGGDLGLPNGKRRYIGATVPNVRDLIQIDNNFFWDKNDKRYAKIDGMFCEIISEKEQDANGETCRIFSAKKVNRDESFFIVNKGKFYSHGDNLKKAFEDLTFKVAAEKIKKEPINEDTIITVQHYRIITGACEMGVKNWMKENNITVEQITAKELLPLLKKYNAYGYYRFKSLVTF